MRVTHGEALTTCDGDLDATVVFLCPVGPALLPPHQGFAALMRESAHFWAEFVAHRYSSSTFVIAAALENFPVLFDEVGDLGKSHAVVVHCDKAEEVMAGATLRLFNVDLTEVAAAACEAEVFLDGEWK